MPRISRKNLESTYFHVMVQGISKEYIFNKDRYKEEYVRLIYQYKEIFNIELYAFCIMGNHAHLLLHINKIGDMSNFMHKINTLYAIYYNKQIDERVGHVFRNRFRSEVIIDNRHLNNCIKYIHNNPVKANIVDNPIRYKFSSFKDYYYKKGLYINKNLRELVDLNYILQKDEVEDIFIDIEKDISLIIKHVREKSTMNNKKISNEEKYKLIKRLKEDYNIPYKKSCIEFKVNERTFRRKMTVLTNVPKADKEENYEV